MDFGARKYDTRIGRWFAIDGHPKPSLSSYQFGCCNPLIFVDPDGNTEYYYNGKWVASDGANNNMIGIVKSGSVKRSMAKGKYSLPTVSNGFNNNDVFTIDADVLSVANKVLGLSLSKKKRR